MVGIFEIIVLIGFLLISSYIIGSTFYCSTIKASYFAIGFCFYLGILELLSFWIMAFQQKKMFFIIIALVIYIVFIFIAFNNYRIKINKSTEFKNNIPWLMITVILIIFVIIFYRSDADDSFYVSNATLFQNSDRLNLYDSSFGIKRLGTVPMYDFQIWESLISIISSLFHLEAVKVMHTYILPVLLVVSASSYLFLGSALLKTENILKCTLFYVCITLYHLFGGYAVYSEGSFLLSRQWQGKAVYLTVVLPVMISILLNSLRTDYKFIWAYMAVCMLAGMALNPTSLYVMGFDLLFMTIAIAVSKKSFVYFLNIMPSAVIALFFTIMIYLRTKQYSGQIEAASQTDSTFVIEVFKQFWGTGKFYLVLYLLSIGLILWKGSKEAKIYSVITPLLLLSFVWNPVMGRFVAEKITKVPSYWRVFWLLPVGETLAYVICLEYDLCKKNTYRYICIFLGIICLCMPGKWMFSSSNGFSIAQNDERISKDVVKFGKEIVSDNNSSIVLGGDDFSTTLRQKYVNIELVYSRYQYILDLFLYRGEEQQATDRSKMMDFANGNLNNYNDIERLLDSYAVDYVILSVRQEKEKEYLINTNKWCIKECSEDNILMQRME